MLPILLIANAVLCLTVGFSIGYAVRWYHQHKSYAAVKNQRGLTVSKSIAAAFHVPEIEQNEGVDNPFAGSRIISPQKRREQALNEFEPSE